MNSSLPNRPRASRVWFEEDLLYVELLDGRVLASRYDEYPRLAQATEDERNDWKIVGAGVGIHWPKVDEDLSTDGLLRSATKVIPARAEAV